MGKPATRDGVTFRRTGLFTCGHFQDFIPAPQPGDKMWCSRCGDYRLVIQLVEGWAVSCRGCSYARFFGTAEWDAGQALGKHKDRKPDHAVSLFRNGKLVKLLDNSEQLPGLGFGLDNSGKIIPF